MLYVPATTVTAFQNNFPATPSPTAAGTTVTSSATVYTKGASYTQIFAATTYESYGFWISIGGTGASATRTDTLIDIAIGGSGSEQIIVPNLLCGWRNVFSVNPMSLFLPIYIPKGARVSARTACATASKAVQVQITLMGGSSGVASPCYAGCHAYGVTYTAGTVCSGTSHTPGNTGVESSFASIGSTTTRDYRAALVIPQGSLATTTMTAISYHWELGIGSTTIAEWYTADATTEMVVGPLPGMPIPCAIPTGAQLQIRAEGSGTSIAHDVGIYCFY